MERSLNQAKLIIVMIDAKFATTTGAETTLPLQTSKEVALKNTTPAPPDLSPATTKVLTCVLNGKTIPVPRVEVTVKTNEAFSFCVEQNTGEPLVSEEELSKLREAETTMRELSAQLSKFSLALVSDEHHRERDELHAKALAGEDVTNHPIKTRDQISLEFRTRAAALRKSLCAQCASVRPIYVAILKRFEKALVSEMRSLEEGDRELALAYDIPYSPSPVWSAAAWTLAGHTGRVLPCPDTDYISPSQFLAGLVEI